VQEQEEISKGKFASLRGGSSQTSSHRSHLLLDSEWTEGKKIIPGEDEPDFELQKPGDICPQSHRDDSLAIWASKEGERKRSGRSAIDRGKSRAKSGGLRGKGFSPKEDTASFSGDGVNEKRKKKRNKE